MANDIGARVITDESVVLILGSRPSNDYWLSCHVLVVGRVANIVSTIGDDASDCSVCGNL